MSPTLHVDNLEYATKCRVNRKVIVVAGKSCGHIYPALSFIDALKEKYKDAKVLLILPKENAIKNKQEFNCQVKYISLSPLRPGFDLNNIECFSKLIEACFQAIFIISDFNPNVVVGFGSLISVPFVMCSWLFRVKTFVHEQNVVCGRANRFLAKFCDKIAISFIDSKKYLTVNKKKIVLTGNPIRKELTNIDKNKALGFLGLGQNKFTILVMGGSQGAHSINKEFLKCMISLKGKFNLQVIHLCGNIDYDILIEGYKDLGINFKVFTFLEQMHYAYSGSDLVVSRAGAISVSEIAYFKIPVIFVPYPYAYEHQLSNALVLKEKGCAIVIDQKEFNAESLRLILGPLITDAEILKNMRLAFEGIPKYNAAESLVREVMPL